MAIMIVDKIWLLLAARMMLIRLLFLVAAWAARVLPISTIFMDALSDAVPDDQDAATSANGTDHDGKYQFHHFLARAVILSLYWLRRCFTIIIIVDLLCLLHTAVRVR